MKTVSLKLTPKERQEEVLEATKPTAPQYPWGTCLRLDGDEMKKLGIDLSTAKAGAIFDIAGQAKLVGFSTSQREGGENYSSVELQITDLGVQATGNAGKKLAKSMYPSMGGEGGEGDE